MNGIFRCALMTVGLSLLQPLVAAAAHNPKLSPDAEAAGASSNLPVLIRYRQFPDADSRAGIVAHHGQITRSFSRLPFIAASIPGSELDSLASDPNVSYVSIDRPVHASVAEYTYEPIQAPAVWAQGYFGKGVGVAVIDSGVSTRAEDLGGPGHSNIVFSASLVPPYSSTRDEYGHGTHVAGLIAGDGADSSGPQDFRTFRGIAPGANIISLKVLDKNGEGTDSSVIAAIDTAIQLKDQYNIRVINLSLGRPIYENYENDPLCQAAEAATHAGILVVAAAGNAGRDLNLDPEGYGTIEAPGNDPYVLTVGAMKTNGTPAIADDTIASYSSKGPSFVDHVAKPDLVAPGNLVPSLKEPNSTLARQDTFVTYLSDYTVQGSSTAPSPDYLPLSGTSMASAVTSGAAAVLLGAYPQLNPAQAKAILMRSADKSQFPTTSQVVANGITYKANYDVFTIGAGYLDLNAAMQLAGSTPGWPSGDALSPVAFYDPGTGDTFLQFDASSLLGSTVLWGSTETYGAQAFMGVPSSQTVLWGSTALTGSTDPNGFTVLWGSVTVNGQTVLWGSGSPEAATSCGVRRCCGDPEAPVEARFFGAPMAPRARPSSGGPMAAKAKLSSGDPAAIRAKPCCGDQAPIKARLSFGDRARIRARLSYGARLCCGDRPFLSNSSAGLSLDGVPGRPSSAFPS